MKVRIFKQSLRFRLSPADIEELKQNRSVKDTIYLTPDIAWSYRIKISLATMPAFRAEESAEESKVELEIPEAMILPWLDSSKELEWSFQQVEPVLKISVEKDIKPHRN